MLVIVHVGVIVFLLVASPIIAAFGLGKAANGYEERGIAGLFRVLLPFVALGLLSVLTADYRGVPTVEWVLPTLLVTILFLICRSQKLFRISWWIMLMAAVFLCLNFFALIAYCSFTRKTKMATTMVTLRQTLSKKLAQESLRKQFPPNMVIREGPVAGILNDESFNHCDLVLLEVQWHTMLTGLYLMTHEERLLWYPGGVVELGSENLQFR